jgi:hypothetical protein
MRFRISYFPSFGTSIPPNQFVPFGHVTRFRLYRKEFVREKIPPDFSPSNSPYSITRKLFRSKSLRSRYALDHEAYTK